MASMHTFELADLAHSSSEPQAQLSSLEALLQEGEGRDSLKLVSARGEEAVVPEVLFPIFRHLLHALLAGETVSLISGGPQLTTQQAADILNVSRPYMVSLLEEGKLPFTRTGKHRRINIRDLMEYKGERDAQRTQGLAKLTRIGEEMGDYPPYPQASRDTNAEAAPFTSMG